MAVSIITGHQARPNEEEYIEMAGLSTDSKPTGKFATGSIFTEVDTGKVYLYNAAGTTWVEWLAP